MKDKHLVFIGRWNPFHMGHINIILNKYKEKNLPILILIRDTDEEISAIDRKKIIDKWIKFNKIKGSSMIIPNIEGIYYGRGVGYNIEEIEAPKDIQSISATDIRLGILNKTENWKNKISHELISLIIKIYGDK
jgi:hypothetical protein